MGRREVWLWVFYGLFHIASLATAFHECSGGKYWDEGKNQCRPCSVCLVNNIVRTPCQERKDTVCGPFKEFNYFSQDKGEKWKLPYTVDSPQPETTLKVLISNKVELSIPDAMTDSKVKEFERIKKEDGAYWKDLSFALIGVFCLMMVVATFVLWFLCRRFRLARGPKMSDELDLGDDADSSYVVLHHFHPVLNVYEPLPQNPETSQGSRQQQRLKRIYRPKRRLLNEYADDVFESEDSAGSKSSRRYPLQAIPENERSDSEGKADEDGGEKDEEPKSRETEARVNCQPVDTPNSDSEPQKVVTMHI